MQRSRAGTVLLLLDCCYAGAFGRGSTHRAEAPSTWRPARRQRPRGDHGVVGAGVRLRGQRPGRRPARTPHLGVHQRARQGPDHGRGRPRPRRVRLPRRALRLHLRRGHPGQPAPDARAPFRGPGRPGGGAPRSARDDAGRAAARGRGVAGQPAAVGARVDGRGADRAAARATTPGARSPPARRWSGWRGRRQQQEPGGTHKRLWPAYPRSAPGRRGSAGCRLGARARGESTAYLPPVPAPEPAGPPAHVQARSPSARRRWVVVGAAALVLLLGVGWFTRGLWSGNGGTNGGGAQSSGAVPTQDLMVIALYGSGKPSLATLDPRTGGTTPLRTGVDAAVTPSISEDRTHLAFIKPTGPAGGVLYVAQTDGLRARPLLDSAAQSTAVPSCSGRPGTRRRRAGRDLPGRRQELRRARRSSDWTARSCAISVDAREPIGPPCWGGDGNVYVSADNGGRVVIWKMPR